VRTPGFFFANPLYAKRRVSLRMVSMEVGQLKVNDLEGNPVEIAAIVVWKVVDSAQAVFEVDHYPDYVRVQAEAAVRTLASRYPYDAHDDAVLSLRGNTQEVAEHLKREIEERVHLAGVRLVEARISHLAYAPEIAQAMLQRQQAGAIIAARQKIVDGAVGMVELALERLSRNKVVELDEERKAAMVSNLLVVLCSERSTQPIVNAGTSYQ
jgi:regulator of protease activity HflC (stomatin/prohibitin superfamily)